MRPRFSVGVAYAMTLLILLLVGDPIQAIRRVIVVELNLGQYRREIERLARGQVEVVGIHRVDGELIAPVEILENLR